MSRIQKFLVTGDRNWSSEEVIVRELEKMPQGALLIHGGAKGADLIAANCWIEMGGEEKEYRAKWDEYGRSAGPIRNRLMLKEHPDIDIVLAFHPDISRSKGTKDMVEIARKAGLLVRIIDGN